MFPVLIVSSTRCIRDAQIHVYGDVVQCLKVRHPFYYPFVLVSRWPTRTGCPVCIGM